MCFREKWIVFALQQEIIRGGAGSLYYYLEDRQRHRIRTENLT